MEITWNNNLIHNQMSQNRRLSRILRVLLPCFLIVIFCAAAIYWHLGEVENARSVGIVGLVAATIIYLIIKAWGTLVLRQARAIPVITIAPDGIRIGNEEISRVDIITVTVDGRGHRRRLFIRLRTGVTRSIYLPRNISLESVKAVWGIR